ncbi:MAG: PEP-CTERM sorting domain-containing protein [Planctomycetes bacterium]|nr:PEP-CTERM sorting domain-containing protein [Planctomycetota bacterium]
MYTRKSLVTMVVAALCAATASAAMQPLTISSAFNYDAVGTVEEIAYCNTFTGVDHQLTNILGQHSMYSGQTYLGGDGGLPADGIIDGGNFEVGRGLTSRYATAAADAAQSNIIRLRANSRETLSAEVVLPAAEQQRYSAINFAFSGERYKFEASKVTHYTASIEVRYAGDSAWHVLWLSTGDNATLGGSFGTGNGTSGLSSWDKNTDTADWAVVHATEKRCGTAGSSGSRYSNTKAGATYLWKFANDLPLDGSKTLEALRISVSTDGVNRPTGVNLFAASAVPVPEPATAGLLALGAAGLIFRRRR